MTQKSRKRRAAFQVSHVMARRRCIRSEVRAAESTVLHCLHFLPPSSEDNFSFALLRSAGVAGFAGSSGFGAGARSLALARAASFDSSTAGCAGAVLAGCAA